VNGSSDVWLVYDDLVTGHHRGFLAGVLRAVIAAGINVIAATSERPTDDVTWIPTTPMRQRNVLANAAQLRRVAHRARGHGTTAFVDLYLDKNIWGGRRTFSNVPRQARVLHHVSQYLGTERKGLAQGTTRLLTRRLASMAENGQVLVVHTNRAAEVMSPITAPIPPTVLGYPVAVPPAGVLQRSGAPTVLFVGAARHEKGLDQLLLATRLLGRGHSVLVVGRQDADTRNRLSAQFQGLVSWTDGPVSYEQLSNAYRTAPLVVLPYRTSFGLHGGPSSVLLEALAHSAPVVITPALKGQLPPGYEGAVVADSERPSHLASAIEAAYGSLDRLAAKARHAGPAFIRSYHNFDRYVEGLFAVLGGSAQSR
jgi:glycosyltransferase involved in cell wall biosynthesis